MGELIGWCLRRWWWEEEGVEDQVYGNKDPRMRTSWEGRW